MSPGVIVLSSVAIFLLGLYIGAVGMALFKRRPPAGPAAEAERPAGFVMFVPRPGHYAPRGLVLELDRRMQESHAGRCFLRQGKYPFHIAAPPKAPAPDPASR